MVGRMVPVINRYLGFIPCYRIGFHRSLHHHRAPDYYAILGVSKHADLKDIKFAYFNMAKKFHPDTNKTLDARQMFALIAEAYDVLSDDERRSKYDDTGLSEDKFGGSSQGPGRQTTDDTYTAEQMYQKIFGCDSGIPHQEENVHEDFAETHAGSSGSREYIVQVSGKEAVTGVTVGLQLRISGVCDKCRGSRSELGYTGNTCPYCEGTGMETIKTGHITARKTCTYCNGDKIFIKFKCHECHGIGRVMYDVYHPVDVPPGVQHGEVFRIEIDPQHLRKIPGRNEEELQTLYVTVDVGKDENFTVDGRDIVARLELSPAQAILGGRTPFTSPARELEIEVKPGTSSHSVIVLADEGVRASSSSSLPGDLVLRTAIRIPKTLSWKQTRIWRKFAALEGNYPGAGLVDGVPSDCDHRLGVNVVTADNISNTVVSWRELKGMDETFLDTLRDKLGRPKPVIQNRQGMRMKPIFGI